MRILSTLLLSTCLLVGSVSAQVPSDVMNAYKAYNAAMANQDYKSAMAAGKKAWKAAEKSLGKTKTTGDLAYNYGIVAKTRGDVKDAIPALERAVDLAMIDRDKAASVKLERSVELIAAYEQAGEFKDLRQAIEEAEDFAESSGLDRSVFAGEILVHKAQNCSRLANRTAGKAASANRAKVGSRLAANNDRDERTQEIQRRCGLQAKKASEIFAANPKLTRQSYVALAAKETGFYYERANDWMNAALSYQSAREAVEDLYGRDNPFVIQMIGRWVNAREQLTFSGRLDRAKAAGLCDCWPYNANNDKVKAIKTVKADVPRQVLEVRSSGYVILEADVTDSGETDNIRIIDSWPAGEYDQAAIEAYTQYQYAPKSTDEPDGYRQGLVKVFSFMVYNESSGETY